MNSMIKDGIKEKVEEETEKIKKKVSAGKKKVEEKLDIKDDMTPGQKAGKIAEKMVDAIGRGLDSLGNKMNGLQASRFAPIKELRIEGYAKLIGEERGHAITIDRAKRCREFVSIVKQSQMPEDLKDSIAEDVVAYACVSHEDLRQVYLNTKVPVTQAEIEFMKRKLSEVEKYDNKE